MGFAPYVGATGCSGGPTGGAVALQEAALQRWAPAGLYPLGIYNCRPIAGTRYWSLHAEGRAVDLGVTGTSSALQDALLRWLLDLPDGFLQRVMFDFKIYDDETPGGRHISGDNPHTDHAHVELSWPGARGQIPLSPALIPLATPKDDHMLLVNYKGAVFVVSPDLTSCVGLSQSADVSALLSARGGTLYTPVTLSERLMAALTSL